MSRPDGQARGHVDSAGRPVVGELAGIHPSADGVVFNGDGEVLLQRRADSGWWGLPGGWIDVGESAEQCAIREVYEETGLRVEVMRLIGVYSDPDQYAILTYPDGRSVQFVAAVFECRRISGELTISEESTALEYFMPDNLPKDTLLSHRLRIADALAKRPEAFIR